MLLLLPFIVSFVNIGNILVIYNLVYCFLYLSFMTVDKLFMLLIVGLFCI
jgi:hypothetical protein